MIPQLLILSTALLADPDPYSLPGPYAWGERGVGVLRDDGTSVAAQVYYPASAQGPNQPVSELGGEYPIVSFAPGFIVPPTIYASTMRHMASHGYIAIVTSSQSGNFNPDRELYVSDFLGTIDYLTAEDARSESPFFGRVATEKVGAAGHSLGGGISIVAAARDARIDASATFAAASLRDAGPLGAAPPPYADVEIAALDIPVSLINGSLDGLIPVATNGQMIYDAAGGPRLLPNLLGGYHGGFWDSPVSFDEGTVSQEENLAFARAELLSFFDLYLQGDQSAWRRQWGPERLAAASVETQLDPGFSITPDMSSRRASDLGLAVYDMTLQNDTDHSTSYQLFVEDNQWELTFSTQQTEVLSPGESIVVQAFVSAPPDATAPDRALVSARSDRDGGTRAWTYLETKIVPEPATLAMTLTGGFIALGLAIRRRRTTTSPLSPWPSRFRSSPGSPLGACSRRPLP
ncbi:MAG: PEP-CTERM sorting domain-containing protein [Pirellulales bacterium]